MVFDELFIFDFLEYDYAFFTEFMENWQHL